MSDISDLQLYYNYKSTGNPSVLVEFFKRYKKLVSKIFYHYFKGYSWHYCYDDFKQEAFIVLYKTIKSVDENRIHTPETWKLYDLYKWGLCTRARQIKTKLKKYSDNVILIENEDSISEDLSNLQEFNIITHQFMKTLTEKERVLFYRKNLSYETWTLERLSKSMKMPISTLASINKRLIRRFGEFYK